MSNNNSKIFSIIKLIRPLNCLIAFATVLAAGLIASLNEVNYLIIILAGATAFLSTSAGNSINDYFDIETDRINRPQRPLPSGLLTKYEVIFFYIILTILSLITSSFINQVAFAITLGASLLMFVYSYILKKLPLIGNVTVSFLTGIAFIFGGTAVGNLYPVLFPAALAFIINLIREIVKDAEDIEGDKKSGLKTFPILYGLNKTKRAINTLIITSVLVILIPFFIYLYNEVYLIIILFSVIPILAFSLFLLEKNFDKNSFGKVSSLLKVSMIFGLIAIYFGR